MNGNARTPEQTAVRRHLPMVLVLLVGAVGVALLALLRDQITGPVASIVTGLAWPYVVLVALVLFRSQVGTAISDVAERIRHGNAMKFGPFQLPEMDVSEEAEHIPKPAVTDPVTARNVALLHTSFFSPSGTQRFADGRKYYQFEVIVVAADTVMERIDFVTYHLEAAWTEERQTKVVRDRLSRFKMKELANGTSIVTAEVHFKGQDDALWLNRFIDLRTDGPRI